MSNPYTEILNTKGKGRTEAIALTIAVLALPVVGLAVTHFSNSSDGALAVVVLGIVVFLVIQNAIDKLKDAGPKDLAALEGISADNPQLREALNENRAAGRKLTVETARELIRTVKRRKEQGRN